jgi:hypothetical protein
MAETPAISRPTSADTSTAGVPAEAPPLCGAVVTVGARYAPTQVSVEAGAFIEDGCPIHYEIEASVTWIVLGDTNAAFNLQLSDRALINLATVTNRAAHALLRDRGKAIPSADSDADL